MDYLKNGTVNRIKDLIDHMDKCDKEGKRCAEHLPHVCSHNKIDEANDKWHKATRAKLVAIVDDFEKNGYDNPEEPKSFRERLNNNANDFDSIVADMLKHIDKLEKEKS